MKQLNLNEFLELPWGDNVRAKLRDFAARDDVKYLVAWDNAGKMSASAFTSKPDQWPDTALSVWSRDKDLEPMPTKSRTMQAVDLVESGLSVYAAAKQAGVNQSAVHRAIKRREDKPICPCCGQVVRTQAA